MFAVSNLCKNTSYLVLQARFKAKVHWAKARRKTGPKHKALNHFDEFYGSVFGSQWDPMREALMRRSKYVAVVNNYGDTEKTMDYLSNRGAHCLKNLMSIQQDFYDKYTPTPKPDTQSSLNTMDRLEDYSSRLQEQEISEIYSGGAGGLMPERLEAPGVTLHSRGGEDKLDGGGESKSLRAPTLEQALAESKIDESRIIDPSAGMGSESLYQFVPATKLKGMEEWIPESLHYSYYAKGKDFPLVIEPETNFTFPEHLKVFTYEKDSEQTDFPEPRRSNTGVYNYYPMDCGSVLAVLALCLCPADRVLDLCSAPGGKSLIALQTLLPDVVVCNDISLSRSNRMQRIFRDYFIDFESNNKWRERVMMSRVDGRRFTDDQGFDKVLVDVPCTTDRHSINEDENNIFRSDRIKERLKIPEMQSALLAQALRLVKVGGAVVYSTCSLSPIQNDGVVHMALKQVFETDGVIANVRDLTAPLAGLTSTLQLGTGPSAPKYGQLVVPSVGANFGPSYLSRLVRVK